MRSSSHCDEGRSPWLVSKTATPSGGRLLKALFVSTVCKQGRGLCFKLCLDSWKKMKMSIWLGKRKFQMTENLDIFRHHPVFVLLPQVEF